MINNTEIWFDRIINVKRVNKFNYNKIEICMNNEKKTVLDRKLGNYTQREF